MNSSLTGRIRNLFTCLLYKLNVKQFSVANVLKSLHGKTKFSPLYVNLMRAFSPWSSCDRKSSFTNWSTKQYFIIFMLILRHVFSLLQQWFIEGLGVLEVNSKSPNFSIKL